MKKFLSMFFVFALVLSSVTCLATDEGNSSQDYNWYENYSGETEYLNDYYNEQLEGFVFYSCSEGEKTFYYNEKTFSLIKEIKVEKKFAIKTVEITYDTRSPEEVCGIK